MKSDVMKIVLRVAAAILVVACIWTVMDKLFPVANANDTGLETLTILPAGGGSEKKKGKNMGGGTKTPRQYHIGGAEKWQRK